MSPTPDDGVLRAAFGSARALEPTEAEVARVLARASGAGRDDRSRVRSRRRLRPVTVGLAMLVAFTGAGYAAAPPLRAAIDDAARAFSGWVAGSSNEAPGRALREEEQAPAYFHDPRYVDDPRVIAEADGYKLYAAREPHGEYVNFDLGDTGVGLQFAAGDFKDHAVFVLGPGSMEHADEHGHVPLFGITARRVKTIELAYESGPPLRAYGINGGFVLLARPDRGPREVVALDANGREIERALVDDSSHWGPRIDWSRYGPPAPRVRSECQPGAAGDNPPPGCPSRGG